MDLHGGDLPGRAARAVAGAREPRGRARRPAGLGAGARGPLRDPCGPERARPARGGRGRRTQPCLLELWASVSGSGIIGRRSSGVCRRLETCWADHHGRGLERVAGAFPVVPLNTVELICVLLLRVVHSVQVGRTACIKPPACDRKTQKELGTR